MNACTKNVVCLGDYCSCGDISLEISGMPLGQYTCIAEFNGVKIKQEVIVDTFGKVTLNNIFNENYVHLICFIDSNGIVLNDTWYSLNIKPCVNYAV